jgi:hypothetical protein
MVKQETNSSGTHFSEDGSCPVRLFEAQSQSFQNVYLQLESCSRSGVQSSEQLRHVVVATSCQHQLFDYSYKRFVKIGTRGMHKIPNLKLRNDIPSIVLVLGRILRLHTLAKHWRLHRCRPRAA